MTLCWCLLKYFRPGQSSDPTDPSDQYSSSHNHVISIAKINTLDAVSHTKYVLFTVKPVSFFFTVFYCTEKLHNFSAAPANKREAKESASTPVETR